MSDRTRAFDLFMLAPLGIAVVAYQLAEPSEIIPPVALIACVVARAVQDATGWVLGKRVIAFAVALAMGYVIVDIARNQFQVTLFADFMMILAALKAMERRTPRDDGQLLIVSIFVALAAAVSSNRMGTGMLLVVYLFALMSAVMRMQVDAAVWPVRPVRRGRLWPLLAVCIVGSTVVASIAFVLLPRNTSRWSSMQFAASTQKVTGFRESIELGTGGLISQNQSVVMRVSSVDHNGDPGEAFVSGTPLYMRGVVLDDYEQGTGRWSLSRGTRRSTDEMFRVLPGAPVPISSNYRSAEWSTVRVIQNQGASSNGTVFSLWRPIRASFDQAEGSLVRHADDFALRFQEPPIESIEYRITYGPDIAPEFGERRGAIPAASGSAILRDTAVRVLEQAGIEPDPRQRRVSRDRVAITTLESWLRTSKSYTLDIQPAEPGRDPTEWFVADAEAGHCEYFASALALLCREVGINTRVATGYLSVVENPDADYVPVRRSDAHAWVEAEIAPGYWQVFDATPAAQGGDFGQSVGPLARWLSSIESAWLASFISFDARSQSSLSRSLQRSLSFERLDTSSEDISAASRFPWVRIAAGFALFAIFGSVIAYVRWQRSRSQLAGIYGIDAEVIRQRDELEMEWQRAGSPRPRGTTLAAHASRLGGADTDRARLIERLAFRPVREQPD